MSAAWLPEWDGAAYAANQAHHRVHDAGFLARTPLAPADRVLDVGCGSGEFTAVVARLVPEGHVVGLDPQPSLLAEARAKAVPNQSFVLAAAQQLDTALPPGERFDTVVSRAVFHWIPAAEWPGILAAVHRRLQPGGHFHLECGGAGNVPSAVAFLDRVAAPYGGPTCPWTFADAGWARDVLEDAGFTVDDGEVRTVAQRRRFDRAGMLGWLASQGVQAYDAGFDPDARSAFRAEVAARVDELRRPDGTYDLTYVRLDAAVTH